VATLNWSISVQVTGGPTINAAQSGIQVEAVDRIDVTIAPGAADEVVHIQPGAANTVHLLAVVSDVYDAALTFKASDGNKDSAKVALDAPQVYSGGAAILFGADPLQLKVTNGGANPANLTVFVARKATS
jgi:hypothetical protein